MRTKYTLAVGMAAIIGLIAYILTIEDSSIEAFDRTKTIAIVNFIDHPVLNTIQTSISTTLQNRFTDDELKLSYATAQGRVEEVPQLAQSILRASPDLIVTISTPVTRGVMTALGESQKLVYTFVTDPSVLGDRLNTTNNTGLSDAVNYAANLQLIEDIFGENVRIGFAYNPNEQNSVSGLNVLESLIRGSELQLIRSTVTSESELPQVISSLLSRVDVLYIGGDNLTVGAFSIIEKLATDSGIPIIASDSGSIAAGAIAGYSVDYESLGEITGEIIIRILLGEEPRAIPRISVPGDKLIINTQAAARNGVEIPDTVLMRANQLL